MVAVVALATPMELFFSEVWLVYEYQRDFMPLFVPAGHYFLFDLGRHAANKLREQWVMPLLLPSCPSRHLRGLDGRRHVRCVHALVGSWICHVGT